MNQHRDIVIAGCGIGGLSAAIGLARQGHSVRLLERSSAVKAVGAGISLQPNALQALSELGLEDDVVARGCVSATARLRSADGRDVRRIDCSRLKERFGHLPITIHRGDLMDVLLRAAESQGVIISTGEPLQSFVVNSSRVEAVSTSGRSFESDALIGADGINSQVRAQLWGDRPKRFSGDVCWRGIVTEPGAVVSVDEMTEIWGHGARFGFMRCSPDKVYWFATMSTDRPDQQPSGWKDLFQSWPDPVDRLLQNTPPEQVLFNDISDRKPIPAWSRGPVTLLGDAAHPMTPNFGQGGAQAIEDAVVLANAFSRSQSIEQAFGRYESLRRPRTAWFVNESWNYGRVAQGATRLRRFVRDRVMPLIPESVVNRQLDRQFDFRTHLSQWS